MKTKKIHQTWVSTDTSRFPAEWVNSWKELNPDWEYTLWTDEDIDEFIREEYPDFHDVFEDYDQPIKRPDSWRYLCLQKIGGLYVDMDFACLKPIDSLFEGIGDRFAIGREGDPGSPETFGNSFMACDPNPPFLSGITDDFRRKRHLPVLESSACKFITRRINEEGRQNQILELNTKDIFPLWWNDPRKASYANGNLAKCKEDFPEAFCATFWTGTWLDQ